jgi:hypothetical protein
MSMTWFTIALLLAQTAPRPSLTVVVRGPASQEVAQHVPPALPQLEVRFAPPPNAPAAPGSAPAVPEERIAAARKAYVSADFSKCLDQVDDDAAFFAALDQRGRTTAARVLLWRTACHVGAGRTDQARRAASQLAVLQLDVPPEVGQVSPEVEAVIAQELKRASQLRPTRLAVEADAEASVELDGRPAGCTTPCTLDVLEGSHVLHLTAEGRESATRVVRAETPSSKASFALTPAPPELAAAQWSSRYAQAADVDGARSMQLLATAVRASRLVLLDLEAGAQGRQQAVLAVDGTIAARAERVGSVSSEVAGLVQDLLVRGQLIEAEVPLYKRPLLWVAVVGVAAAIAAGTVAAVVSRHITATVSFK